jgi:hypothetical protein
MPDIQGSSAIFGKPPKNVVFFYGFQELEVPLSFLLIQHRQELLLRGGWGKTKTN